MPELWTKIRLKFGREEILSHFWELDHVLYMYKIVRLCFTCFVLEVCSKDQRIRTLMLKQEARVFELSLGQRLKTVFHWAGLLCSFSSHHLFWFTPPEPICSFFNIFDFFFFGWLCLFFLPPCLQALSWSDYNPRNHPWTRIPCVERCCRPRHQYVAAGSHLWGSPCSGPCNLHTYAPCHLSLVPEQNL